MVAGMNRPNGPAVSFWGGLGIIGGTKVLVEEAGWRVLLDFGLAYDVQANFFDSRLRPRPASILRDYLEFSYAPPIDQIYPEAAVAGTTMAPLPPGESPRTAVFISHLHLDHMGLLDLLASEVPVYQTPDSERLQRALQQSGLLTVRSTPGFTVADRGRVRVGPLEVEAVLVDHDLPGATGYIVHTSAGAVAYSGDLRLHGLYPERTRRFAQRAGEVGVVALVLEGTTLSPGTAPHVNNPEASVAEQVAEEIRTCPGLALINPYPRNVERVISLARAAREAGRTLVLEPGMAGLIHNWVRSFDRAGSLPSDLPAICAYRGGAVSGDDQPIPGLPTVDAEDIRRDQDHFLLQLPYVRLAELVDLRPAAGSVFIHSDGEPLGGFDPAYENLKRWLDHFHLPLVAIRSSGHASPEDLAWIAREVGAGVLFPVHSLHPELLQVPGSRQVLPEWGRRYEL